MEIFFDLLTCSAQANSTTFHPRCRERERLELESVMRRASRLPGTSTNLFVGCHQWVSVLDFLARSGFTV